MKISQIVGDMSGPIKIDDKFWHYSHYSQIGILGANPDLFGAYVMKVK